MVKGLNWRFPNDNLDNVNAISPIISEKRVTLRYCVYILVQEVESCILGVLWKRLVPYKPVTADFQKTSDRLSNVCRVTY